MLIQALAMSKLLVINYNVLKLLITVADSIIFCTLKQLGLFIFNLRR